MTTEATTPASSAAPEPPLVVAPALAAQDSEETSTSVARATTVMALGNITSRVLGFAKEIVLANIFGPGRAVDAFQIAITIPQDLYDLAIFGHTNSALVPVLTEYAAREDKAELWEVVSALASIVLLAAGLLTLGLIIFTPQVITLYRGLPSSGVWAEMFNLRGLVGHQNLSALSPAAFSQTVDLLRLTAPALIFMSLFAVFSGTLFALKRFTRPAFGAAVFNGVIVLSTLALVPAIGIQGVALGWVAGAVVQLLLVFGGLRGSRIRLALAGLPRMLRHPGLRRIGLLYLPVLLTLLIDVAVNRPFSYNIASQTGEGNIGYMKWATSLREFPMGLVGTAISIAILPTLARQALHIDLVGSFRNTLGQGVRLVLTLIVPAAVGMFVLARPLIGLVFEHGSFTAANTAAMSIVLRLYLLGIPFAAIDLLLIFAFYARRDSLTPALIGMFSLACYIAITLILLPSTGFLSLMIADSAKHLIHMSVSLVLLRRRLGGLGDQRLFPTLAKVGLATGLMALITYALALSVADLWPAQGLRERVLLVVVPAMLGGVTYLILASLLRLNELSLFVRALTRRIRR